MSKKIFVAALMMIGSYALADGGQCPVKPNFVGDWNLASRACTSNAALSDTIDSGSLSLNADMSFEMKKTVDGCETDVKGTYAVDGMKLTLTSATSQGCNDSDPVPMVESHSVYAAYADDKEAVFVATGDHAAASCPAGDALILNFEKAQPSHP